MHNSYKAALLLCAIQMCLAQYVDSAEDEGGSKQANVANTQTELAMGTADSIRNQYEVDSAPKDYKLKLPIIDTLFSSWGETRSQLAEQYGFRPNFSATHVYQETSDSIGPEDSAAGYEVVIDGTWTFSGRHTASAATAGFEFLYRDFTSDIPPVALFTQAGTLYPSTVAFS